MRRMGIDKFGILLCVCARAFVRACVRALLCVLVPVCEYTHVDTLVCVHEYAYGWHARKRCNECYIIGIN